MSIGERIRQARLEKGISQRELCGEEITRNMLSLIENGAASPSLTTLQYLAGRLDKKVSWFLDEDTVSSPNQACITAAYSAWRAGDPAGAGSILEAYASPDPVFDRDGLNIWVDVPVTYLQAVLGAEIVVPTIDGKVKYKIEPGTQPGTVFRLKGRGAPKINSKIRGDQYVKVTVEVPKQLTKEQEKLLRAFEDSMEEKNYEKRKSFFQRLSELFE